MKAKASYSHVTYGNHETVQKELVMESLAHAVAKVGDPEEPPPTERDGAPETVRSGTPLVLELLR